MASPLSKALRSQLELLLPRILLMPNPPNIEINIKTKMILILALYLPINEPANVQTHRLLRSLKTQGMEDYTELYPVKTIGSQPKKHLRFQELTVLRANIS